MLCVFEQQNVDELGFAHTKTRQVVAIAVKNLNHQGPKSFRIAVVCCSSTDSSLGFTTIYARKLLLSIKTDDMIPSKGIEHNIVFTIPFILTLRSNHRMYPL